eukprot:gene140-225_t
MSPLSARMRPSSPADKFTADQWGTSEARMPPAEIQSLVDDPPLTSRVSPRAAMSPFATPRGGPQLSATATATHVLSPRGATSASSTFPLPLSVAPNADNRYRQQRPVFPAPSRRPSVLDHRLPFQHNVVTNDGNESAATGFPPQPLTSRSNVSSMTSPRGGALSTSRSSVSDGNWNLTDAIQVTLGTSVLPPGVKTTVPTRAPDTTADALTLDISASVTSPTFAILWDTLPVSREVTAYSFLIQSNEDIQTGLRRLTLAIESSGLFPVAVGATPDGGYRCYLFGVGYYLTYPVRIEKHLICAFELDFVRGEAGEVGMWVFVRCKCLDSRRSGEFMKFLVGGGILLLEW